MDKLKMQTPDLTDKNIEKIAKIFPNVITETRDENGSVMKAVDFDMLKQALSKTLVEDDNERYRLDWPGKKASLLKANTPITKTLRPCRKESVNFDTTENLYIEGDNFDVLKILQESYLGKVKMIYIDPPYNTGNDFIYKDKFVVTKEEYDEELGITDEEGGRLYRNTDSNGRFHSDWLSMMYERLVVARDLLRDDGAIFISIDDNEIAQIRKVCDELYGEDNFAGCIARKTKLTSNKGIHFSPAHEYIIVYAKAILNLEEFSDDEAQEDEDYIKLFKHKDDKGQYNLVSLYMPSLDKRPNQRYYITCPDGSKVIGKEGKMFRWTEPTLLKNIAENRVVFTQTDTSPLLDENGEKAKWNVYTKLYLHERQEKGLRPVTFFDKYPNSYASKDLIKMEIPFDFSKPKELIKYLMKISNIKDKDMVLDFFSGSATTAHAVMQLNAEDGGSRKFIMIQLPEKIDEENEAFRAGYKTITEIGKERIRRAGKKILEELKTKNMQLKLGEETFNTNKLDIGFRVYKTDDTNMKDVFYHPAKLDQKQLSFVESNIKEDRTPEDLLTQVILDLGLELSLPIEMKKLLGNIVYIVQTNALVACFDKDIDFKIVDTISDLKPFKVVFKDASFKDDKDRINVEERFKRLSPGTKVTVI